MKMLSIVLLIIVTIVLLANFVESTGQEENLLYNLTLNYLPSVNVTVDNSTNNLTGTISGNPEFSTTAKKLGDASTHFTSTTKDGIVFNDSIFKTMINQTIALWINGTKDISLQYILARRVFDSGGLDGEFEFEYTGNDLKCMYFLTGDADPSASVSIGTNHQINTDWELIGCVLNVTGTKACVQVYINKTMMQEGCGEGLTWATPINNLTIGRSHTNDKYLVNNGIDALIYSNKSWTSDDFEYYWNKGAGLELLGQYVDITNPIVNISFNVTQVETKNMVNITGNSSDETGLSRCQIITNNTGYERFFNFTLSGISGHCSQNISIVGAVGTVINFTIIVNDTSNNIDQESVVKLVGDITSPTINYQNISDTTPYSDENVNISCSVTDSSPLNFVKVEINKTNYTMTDSGNDYYAYVTTWGIGFYNITRFYAEDTSGNAEMTDGNVSFTVTARPSDDVAVTTGGGGSVRIVEKSNVSLDFKPSLISSNFIYTPFTNINQTFSIEITANKPISECKSDVFDCEIIDDVTFVVSKPIGDDTKFTQLFEDKINVIAQDDEAKFINTKLQVFNIAYYIEVDLPAIIEIPALVKVENSRIVGIRMWPILLLLLVVIYFIRKAQMSK